MSLNRVSAAKHLGSILENINNSHPTETLVINESSLNLAKGLVINHILEASNQSEKLRSAEVPESRVGYNEPTGNGNETVTLDDNGGYVGKGKDTYYHSDRGQNSNQDNSENLTGSKQNYVESSTGKEAAGETGEKEISESGMGLHDFYELTTRTGGSTTTHDEPDAKAMTRTGGSTTTHDEPDAKTIKKMGGIGKPPSVASNPKKDAAKAIADVFKKFN